MLELTHQTLTLTCQAFRPKMENQLKILQGKSKGHKIYVLLEETNPPITFLIGEPMEV